MWEGGGGALKAFEVRLVKGILTGRTQAIKTFSKSLHSSRIGSFKAATTNCVQLGRGHFVWSGSRGGGTGLENSMDNAF